MEKSNGRARIEDYRHNTEYLGVMSIRRIDIFTGRGIKESEYIHLPGIDVGGR